MTSTNSSPASPPKFRFKRIGPVKEAELELGDLTVIAGHNNTGKTYLVYTLYGFLALWDSALTDVEDVLMGGVLEQLTTGIGEGRQVRHNVNMSALSRERSLVSKLVALDFSKATLSNVFSSPKSAFDGASIDVGLSDDFPMDERVLKLSTDAGDVFSLHFDGREIKLTKERIVKRSRETSVVSGDNWHILHLYLHFLLPELSLKPFVLSAERFGISLFYKELDFTKNRLVDFLQQLRDEKDRERYSPFLLIDHTTSRYALPIKDNIDYTRSISDHQKDKSEVFEDKLFDDIKEMMEGYFRSTGDDIQFRSKARKDRSFTIPLHRASSSARGLSDLYFFLRHVAKKNHLLIIDEPESHLDTANQILLARLLARCVRAGLKVLITTHSDYLIKEINNLIMLSRPFAGKNDVVKKLRYREDDFLAPESVRAYIAEKHTLRQCEVDDFGIDMPVFDKTINQINTAANELASRLAESLEL